MTGGLLLITIPHFGEFTPANFPYRWTIFYAVDPLVIGLILWLLRGRDAVPAGRNPFAALISLLHFGRFKPGLPTWTWFALFLAESLPLPSPGYVVPA